MNARIVNSVWRSCKLVLVSLVACGLPRATIAELPNQNDIARAVAKARGEKKTVLLHFNGTEWCGQCKEFETEVAKTSDYRNYIASNFVLLVITFSAGQESPLTDIYGISGWPTLVLLDADGHAFDKIAGYQTGDGPQAIIQKIEARRKRE